MKHISASSSDNVDIGCDSQELKTEESEKTSMSASFARKVSGRMVYQEKALELISQLVVKSQIMAKSMQVASGFMNNLEKYIKKTNREVVDCIGFFLILIFLIL